LPHLGISAPLWNMKKSTRPS